MRLQAIYEKYKGRADFYWIYVKEAHAIGSARPNRTVKIAQPGSFEERRKTATQCSSEIRLHLPLLVDDMQDSVAKAYNAMPDRLYILGTDGKIAYRGARGPRGFDVDEMAKSLEDLLKKAN